MLCVSIRRMEAAFLLRWSRSSTEMGSTSWQKRANHTGRSDSRSPGGVTDY